MHLEELFQFIEENRREFIARRAEKVCFAGSAVGVCRPGENEGEKSPNEQVEPAPAQVEAI